MDNTDTDYYKGLTEDEIIESKKYYIELTDNEVIELYCAHEFLRTDRYINERIKKIMKNGDNLSDENKKRFLMLFVFKISI